MFSKPGNWFGGTAIIVLGFVAMSQAQPGSQSEERDGIDRPPRRERADDRRRAGPLGPEEIFQKIDADGDGSISKEEFLQHHEERFRRGGPPGPPPRGGERGVERGGQADRGDRGSPGQFGPPPGPPPRGEGFERRGPPPPPRGGSDEGDRRGRGSRRGPRGGDQGFGGQPPGPPRGPWGPPPRRESPDQPARPEPDTGSNPSEEESGY